MLVWGISISWIILAQLGPAPLALYGASMSIAAILFILFLAPLGENIDRPRLFMYSYWVLLLSSIGRIAIVAYLDANLFFLTANDIIAAAGYALTRPAALPTLIEMNKEQDNRKIISFFKTSESIARLAAPIIGGLILSLYSGLTALLAVSLMMIIALATIKPVQFPKKNTKNETHNKTILADITSAIVIKLSIPQERHWFILSSALLFSYIPISSFLLILYIEHQSMSPTWLGLAQASLSTGSLLGYAIFSRFLQSFLSFTHLNALTVLGSGVAIPPALLGASPVLLLAGYFLIGLLFSSYSLNNQSVRLLAMPKEYRVRMNSLTILTGQVISSIAVLFASFLYTRLGLDYTIYYYCAAFYLIGLLFLLTPGRLEFDKEAQYTPDEAFLRLHPEVFKSR